MIARLGNKLSTGLAVVLCVAGIARCEVYTVKATAEGSTVAEAREAALGKALGAIMDKCYPEKTLETKENWIRLCMTACPAFVIQKNYKIVAMTSPENNDWTNRASVTVEVALPSSRLDEVRGPIEEWKKAFGEPTVMIIIDDRKEDARWSPPRITVRGDSDAAQEMKEALNKIGFRVIIKRQTDINKESKVAKAEFRGDDLRTVQAMALKNQAHVFVWGEGRVQGPLNDPALIKGQGMSTWSADAKCEMYWADDASLIGTVSAVAEYADQNADHAAVRAVKEVGKTLAKKIVADVFAAFCKWAAEGRPVNLEVADCSCDEGDEVADFLRAKLGEDKVLDVQCDNGLVNIRTLTKQRADDFRRLFRGQTFKAFSLKANEQMPNSMQFKCVH